MGSCTQNSADSWNVCLCFSVCSPFTRAHVGTRSSTCYLPTWVSNPLQRQLLERFLWGYFRGLTSQKYGYFLETLLLVLCANRCETELMFSARQSSNTLWEICLRVVTSDLPKNVVCMSSSVTKFVFDWFFQMWRYLRGHVNAVAPRTIKGLLARISGSSDSGRQLCFKRMCAALHLEIARGLFKQLLWLQGAHGLITWHLVPMDDDVYLEN